MATKGRAFNKARQARLSETRNRLHLMALNEALPPQRAVYHLQTGTRRTRNRHPEGTLYSNSPILQMEKTEAQKSELTSTRSHNKLK